MGEIAEQLIDDEMFGRGSYSRRPKNKSGRVPPDQFQKIKKHYEGLFGTVEGNYSLSIKKSMKGNIVVKNIYSRNNYSDGEIFHEVVFKDKTMEIVFNSKPAKQ